jgi:hypothetical protein
MQPLSIKFKTVCKKKTHLEHLFPELLDIYLSRDIKSRNFIDEGCILLTSVPLDTTLLVIRVL